MATNNEPPGHQERRARLPVTGPMTTRLHRFAWMPAPVLLVAILGLWAVDLRTVHESQALLVALNFVFSTVNGWLPMFFVQGQGGTAVRQAVLGAAIVMFVGTVALLWAAHRSAVTTFVRWYGLALLLVATGLLGVMLQSVTGSALNWAARAAQMLGGAYMLVAAIASVRETGTWRLALDAARWDDRLLRALTPQRLWTLPAVWRYGLALLLAVAATVLRWAILPWIGTVAPYNLALLAIVLATILLGIGPGLLCLLVADIAVEVFILGSLAAGPDGATLGRMGISVAIGALVIVILHSTRVARLKAQESAARLAAFASATSEGIAESEAGRILDCNGQMARMLGYTVAELRGMAIANLIAPEDRERVLANIQPNRESDIEHAMLRKDGARIIVEAHGRPVTPGSLRRHTVVRDITARKQAEAALETSRRAAVNLVRDAIAARQQAEHAAAALQASEEKYRNLFTNMAEEVHFWQLVRDENGGIKTWRLVDANPPTLETWGRSSIEEIRGQTTDEIFGPGATEHYRAVVEKIMAEGVPYSFEDYFPHLDKHFRFTSVPLGEYFITTGADITGIKRAELALRASEERLRRLYAAMTEGLVLHEVICTGNGQATDYRLLDVNPAFERITGISRQRAVGALASELYGTGAPPYLDMYARVAASGQPESFETDFGPMDKSFHISVFSPAQGQFATVFDDITERKAADKALLASQEDLERAQAVGQVGSWRLDTRRNLLTWSGENHRIFGLPKGAPMSYETFLNTIHPDDRQYVDTQWQAGMRGAPYDIEHRIVVAGQVKWVREKAYLEFDAAGQLLGGFGITQDITARKQAEEALRALLHEKEVLLKEVHHRVKNNMQVLASLVSLQADNVDDPAVRGVFDDFRDQVRAMALVHESLYQAENLASIDFADYAGRMTASLARAHGRGNSDIRLTLDVEPVTLPVESAVPCGLILNELVTNAYKHAFRDRTAGEIVVSIHADPAGRVCLGVRDNGVGLPPGFDWRQSPSLGLRLVQMLTRQLRGRFDLCAENGTAFQLAFAPSTPKEPKGETHA